MDCNQTILLIEDNLPSRKLLEDVLTSEGYRFLHAIDAENGLVLAREQRPDLILMDLALPGMDGLTATRLIREDPEIGSTIVVALTAQAMMGDRERALDAGCNAYVSKPFSIMELNKLIRELLA